jgi:hypothetical protein
MFNHSSFIFFTLFVWLLSGAVATIPPTVYRGEGPKRTPAVIKAAGGIKSRGACHKLGPSDATLIQHVTGQVKAPMRDPWISTSSDITVSQNYYPDGYIYHIDTRSQGFSDVAAEFVKAGKKYGHASEKEWAINCDIPWSSIIKWHVMKNGKVIRTQTRLEFDGSPGPASRPASSKPASPRRVARAARLLQQRMQRRAEIMDMLRKRKIALLD